MFQVVMGPDYATDVKHNLMSHVHELLHPLFISGEPVEIRKATKAAVRKESEVHNTDKEFLIQLELHDYLPEDVEITLNNHHLTVTAKHDKKHDSHGYVSREVTHVYNLPEDVDPKSLTSAMNSRGILIIRGTKQTFKTPEAF